jgi:hypothetical protein
MLLHEFSDPTTWMDSMVAGWETIGGPALQARGTFHVSLSGGSTPKPLYQRLAKLKWPWSSTRLYLGDERWVTPDHKDSNYRMIQEAFHGTGVHIERVHTEIGTAEIGARAYEKQVRNDLGDPPRFDLQIDSSEDHRHHAGPEAGKTVIQTLDCLVIPGWMDGAKRSCSIDKPFRIRNLCYSQRGIKIIDSTDKVLQAHSGGGASETGFHMRLIMLAKTV